MKKVIKPYELMFRFKDGELSGGHIQDIEQVLNDDLSLYSEKILECRVISKDSVEYADLLAGIDLNLVDSVLALESEKTVLEQTISALEVDKTALEGEKINLTNDKLLLDENIINLESEKLALESDKTALNQRILDLEAEIAQPVIEVI